jgi:hypothetical protein
MPLVLSPLPATCVQPQSTTSSSFILIQAMASHNSGMSIMDILRARPNQRDLLINIHSHCDLGIAKARCPSLSLISLTFPSTKKGSPM